MKQDRQTGAEARRFGHTAALKVASALEVKFINLGKSNLVSTEKGLGVIKSARTSSYIGILKTMFPDLSVVYAVDFHSNGSATIYELTKEQANSIKFLPAIKKNQHMWFIKISDIRKIGTVRAELPATVTGPSASLPKSNPPEISMISPSLPIPVLPTKQGNGAIAEAFAAYNTAMQTLKKLGAIRSHNNPAGDYGEYVAAQHLGLKLLGPSVKGADAIDDAGVRYQIKTRRLTKENKMRHLGGFRDLEQGLFDYCLAVILDEDFTTRELWKIPHSVIHRYAKPTTRGFKVIVLEGPILKEEGVANLHLEENGRNK